MKFLTFLLLFMTPYYLWAQLDNYIQAQMESQHILGLSACVVKNQEVVWQKAYGIANIETNQPVEISTLFTVASISKLFVATAVMQVVEKGLLDLDADINDYLDFEVINPNFPSQKITTKMLLQHRSSLIDPEGDMYDYWAEGDHPSTLKTFLEHIITEQGSNYQNQYWSTNSAPNAAQQYSNIGFAILGLLVEEIMEMPYNSYCQKHIFEPLCMENTTFFWDGLDKNQAAMPHRYQNGQYEPYGFYSIALYPSALIKTNIEELANFLLAYTGRGTIDGVQLLQSSSVDLLTPMSLQSENLAWWNGLSWTFTFHFPDDELWYHGGYMPGIRTRINYYPSDSTGIIILTNSEGQYGLIEEELERNIIDFATMTPNELPCETSTANTPRPLTIQLYPSPSKGTFFIKKENIEQVKLYNGVGERLDFESTPDLKRISLNYKGLVLVFVQTKDNERFVRKIILE